MKFEIIIVLVACLCINPIVFSAQISQWVDYPSFEAVDGWNVPDGNIMNVGPQWSYWGTGTVLNPLITNDVQAADGNNFMEPQPTYVASCYMDGATVGGVLVRNSAHKIKQGNTYTLDMDVYVTQGGNTSGWGLFMGYSGEDITPRTSFSAMIPNRWTHYTTTGIASQNNDNRNGFIVILPNNSGKTYIDNVTLVEGIKPIEIIETDLITLVSEQGTTFDSYNIVLYQQPTADVVVTEIPASNRINLGAGPGIARTFTFTAANWATPQTVTVTAIDDSISQSLNSYVSIAHAITSADSAFNGSFLRKVIVGVIDNDGADLAIAGSVIVSELGPTYGTYNVRLGTLVPSSPVTVNIAYDANQITVSPSQLTFTAGNYATPQIVTVTAVANDILEPYSQDIAIQHTTSSADILYNGMLRTLNITVHDKSCGAWGYVVGDINHDCVVDFKDIAAMAAGWLGCTRPDDVGCIQL